MPKFQGRLGERVEGVRKEGSFLKVRERVCEHKGSLGI